MNQGKGMHNLSRTTQDEVGAEEHDRRQVPDASTHVRLYCKEVQSPRHTEELQVHHGMELKSASAATINFYMPKMGVQGRKCNVTSSVASVNTC